MKALVIYYSRTGNTETVAEALAAALQCDKEAIIDTKKRSGPLGYVSSGRDAKQESLTVIEDIKRDVSEYDLVIIGTPVWAGRVSTPVRTFIHQHKNLKRVAFFTTQGSEDPGEALKDMEALSGKTPVCVLSIRSNEVEKGDFDQKISQFVRELNGS
ncbi:MAG: NAD(P)H-dependent oxidoreductase [Theionarchaea archaeon]|nr:NAD(P)H-dependent oxidoreductase [Theionarchaea archaeon]